MFVCCCLCVCVVCVVCVCGSWIVVGSNKGKENYDLDLVCETVCVFLDCFIWIVHWLNHGHGFYF